MEQQTAIDPKKLQKYLNEHLLGSESGQQHFKSAVETWAGTAQEHHFTSLWQQVKDDQSDLKLLIDRMGYPKRPLVQIGAPLAKLAGFLNPFNPLRMRKLSLAQVQLDVLTGLLNAKLRMWHTLLLMVPLEPRLNKNLLEDLANRAESQIEQLMALSDDTWAERFAPNP